MEIKQVSFECINPDGLKIVGVELRNEKEGKLPAVICCHGFIADMSKAIPTAEFIAELGYRAFAFDFNGGGFTTKSEGSFEDYMTPMTEKKDLITVYNYVRSLDHVDPEKIFLLGQSQGGFICVITAAELKEKIAGIILEFPALCIPDNAREGQMQVIKFDPNNIPDHVGESPMRLSGDYPRCVLDMDAYQTLKEYKGPVLLMHGTEDDVVNISYSYKAEEALKENGNEFYVHYIEGAKHSFKGEFFPEASERIEFFLKQVL